MYYRQGCPRSNAGPLTALCPGVWNSSLSHYQWCSARTLPTWCLLFSTKSYTVFSLCNIGGRSFETAQILCSPLSFHSYHYGLVFSFLLVNYNPLFSLFILMSKMSQIWPMGVLPNWLLCPFDMFPSFFRSYLTFWFSKMLHAHLVLSLPHPVLESAIFPRVPGYF
jgi:hypothetical protein